MPKHVVYKIAGVDQIVIRHGIVYQTLANGDLTMDLYLPPQPRGQTPLPVLIFIFGFSDSLMLERSGYRLKDSGQYVSWSRLAAAAGFAAITYETRDPTNDIGELIRFIRKDGENLGIDKNRIALWACSGNVPTALSLLMHDQGGWLRCAVLYYGPLLDPEGSNDVATAAASAGFANPVAGKSIADLPPDVPLFLVRAGRDTPALNQTIDDFLEKAVARNLPLTVVNHAHGEHGFDVSDETPVSQAIIRQTLDFLRTHLYER